MTSTLSYFGNQSASDWKGMIEHLKKANAEFQRALPIMTRYEASSIGQSIVEKKEQYRPTIEGGVLAVFQDAKNRLQGALTIVEREKAKITNSWDASKLAPELQVYSMRIDAAARNGDRAALEAIYAEAKNSGDRFKLRAAAEAVKNALRQVPAAAQDEHGVPVRQAVNRLEKQAARDLETLQTSPELTKAYELKAAKIEELNQARKSIDDASEAFREVSPNGSIMNSNFIKALESVIQDANGNFIFKE